jgi:hypothetical protein
MYMVQKGDLKQSVRAEVLQRVQLEANFRFEYFAGRHLKYFHRLAHKNNWVSHASVTTLAVCTLSVSAILSALFMLVVCQ